MVVALNFIEKFQNNFTKQLSVAIFIAILLSLLQIFLLDKPRDFSIFHSILIGGLVAIS